MAVDLRIDVRIPTPGLVDPGAWNARVMMAMNYAMWKVREYLEAYMPERFKSFERYRHLYSELYARWKDRMNLPVGVKTGGLKRHIEAGGTGPRVTMGPNYVTAHFEIDEMQGLAPGRQYGTSYFFNEWLKNKAQDFLVDIDPVQQEEIEALFYKYFFIRLRQI